MCVSGTQQKPPPLKLFLDENIIKQVREFRYLGMHFYEKINISKTAAHLMKISRKCFYVLQQKVAYLPPDHR